MIPSFVSIPENWQRRYMVLRILMHLVLFVVVLSFVLRALFPIIEHSFNFRTPSSSRNAILDPRSPENLERTNGKIEAGGTLIANTALVGDFSSIKIKALLESKSSLPEHVLVTLKRTYRTFLYPLAPTIASFPQEVLVKANGTYYALRDKTLYPFVSEKAFATRYPLALAKEESEDFISHYAISEDWLGFRPGTLISNATGVFIVTNEEEIRPIGSAEIFLALGYNFDDVIRADEEEVGIYKRGRIFLLGDTHPDGTVFKDADTEKYFIIENSTRRPLEGEYRDFLISGKHPLLASSSQSEEEVRCDAVPVGIFAKQVACTTALDNLRDNLGNEYEIHITSPETDIDMNTLTLSFITDKNTQNLFTLLSQIKQRLLSRFGYGNE